MADNWEVEKPNTPFGQLPILKVKGLGVIAQSSSIAQYVASIAGFMPSDHFTRARVLMVYEQFRDIRTALGKAKYSGTSKWADRDGTKFFVSDKAAQKEAYGELRTTKFPTYLGDMEKLFPEEGFFLGMNFGPSLADIAAFASLQMLVDIGEKASVEMCKKLKGIHAAVLQLGTLREFLKNDRSVLYFAEGDHA